MHYFLRNANGQARLPARVSLPVPMPLPVPGSGTGMGAGWGRGAESNRYREMNGIDLHVNWHRFR
jgi:hypothetical protein